MELDAVRAEIWGAIREHWPAHAEADQAEPGNIRVTYLLNNEPLSPNKRAQWVSVRFDDGVIEALRVAEPGWRAEVLLNISRLTGWALRRYDPEIERGQAFLIHIDDRALDRA